MPNLLEYYWIFFAFSSKAHSFPKQTHEAGEFIHGINIQHKFKVTIGPPITATKLKQSKIVHDFFKNNIKKLKIAAKQKVK